MGKMTRRKFTKAAIGTTALAVVTPCSRVLGASEDIRIAVVGIRGRGRHHINWFNKIKGVRVVALCDADKQYLDREEQKFKRPTRTPRSTPTSITASCSRTKT